MSIDGLRYLESILFDIKDSIKELHFSKKTKKVLKDVVARLGESAIEVRVAEGLPLGSFHRPRRKRYIIYGETDESEVNFVVLGFEETYTPRGAFKKWMKKDSAKNQIKIMTNKEVQVREVAEIEDIHYFYVKNKLNLYPSPPQRPRRDHGNF